MAVPTPTPPTPPSPTSPTCQSYLGDLGQTLLHLAGMQGEAVMAQLLVRYNANPGRNTQDGSSVMHMAAFSSSVDVIVYVRPKCQVMSIRKVTEPVCAKNYELIFQRP